MIKLNTQKQQQQYSRFDYLMRILMGFLMLLVAACEAPLVLDLVEQEKAKDVLRFDMYQSVAQHGDRVVVVSSTGAALLSDDMSGAWKRFELSGRPSLIDVASCPSGDFFALDSQHQIWQLPTGAKEWSVSILDTEESTLSIHCSPNNTLWVSASFSTLYSSTDNGASWNTFTINEDLQFTQVQFVDEQTGFAVGEFGTVLVTNNGGADWDWAETIPNDFYPMASFFRDAQSGWVGGLGGVIWATTDGGTTWERQQSAVKSPVYGINAMDSRVFAVGGSGTLMEYINNEWQLLKGAPAVLSYLRGLAILPDRSLLVVGGAGTLAAIELPQSQSLNNTADTTNYER